MCQMSFKVRHRKRHYKELLLLFTSPIYIVPNGPDIPIPMSGFIRSVMIGEILYCWRRRYCQGWRLSHSDSLQHRVLRVVPWNTTKHTNKHNATSYHKVDIITNYQFLIQLIPGNKSDADYFVFHQVALGR